jgi:hypothetical protein
LPAGLPDSVGQNSFDRLGEVDPGLPQGGRKTGVGAQARIGVDLQNPGLSLVIDPKVDPGIASQSE